MDVSKRTVITPTTVPAIPNCQANLLRTSGTVTICTNLLIWTVL